MENLLASFDVIKIGALASLMLFSSLLACGFWLYFSLIGGRPKQELNAD